MGSLSLSDLRNKLFDVYDGKLSVHDWCEMHKKFNECGFDINEGLFPSDSDPTIYQNIAQHIFTTLLMTKRLQKNNKSVDTKTDTETMLKSHKLDRKVEGIIKELYGSSHWNSILMSGVNHRRRYVSDEIVLSRLGDEIWDQQHQKKDIKWLILWCLRFSFASAFDQCIYDDRISHSEKLDIEQWVQIIYYTCAYKDKNLFEKVFDDLPSKLYTRITSLKILNSTLMTNSIDGIDTVTQNQIRVIRMKTIPFTNNLTKWDVLELISCGIFPIRIAINQHKTVSFGLIGSFLDLTCAQMYVAPSMCYFSPSQISIESEDTKKIIKGMRYVWYIYNMFIIKCVNTMNLNRDEWSESHKDYLFNYVIKSISPAYNSFVNVLCGQYKQRSIIHTENQVKSPMNQNYRIRPNSPMTIGHYFLPEQGSGGLKNPKKSGNRGNPETPMSPLILSRSISSKETIFEIDVNESKSPKSMCSLDLDHSGSPRSMYNQQSIYLRDSCSHEGEDAKTYCEFTRNMQKILMKEFSKQFIELSRNNGSCFRFDKGTFMKYMPFRFCSFLKNDVNLSDYRFTTEQFTLSKHITIKGTVVSKMYGMVISFTKTNNEDNDISFFETNEITE